MNFLIPINSFKKKVIKVNKKVIFTLRMEKAENDGRILSPVLIKCLTKAITCKGQAMKRIVEK